MFKNSLSNLKKKYSYYSNNLFFTINSKNLEEIENKNIFVFYYYHLFDNLEIFLEEFFYRLFYLATYIFSVSFILKNLKNFNKYKKYTLDKFFPNNLSLFFKHLFEKLTKNLTLNEFNIEEFSNYNFIYNQEKKILNFLNLSFYLLIFLSFVSLSFNYYLKLKNLYVEDNIFFLNKFPIFVFDLIIEIILVSVLSLSFFSIFSIILSLFFLIFNNFYSRFRKNNDHRIRCLNDFFSWKNKYVFFVFFSSLASYLIPLFLTILKLISKNFSINDNIPSDLVSIFKDLSSSISIVSFVSKNLFEKNFAVFHYLILSYFLLSLSNKRKEEINNYWSEINSTEEKINNFINYCNYKNNFENNYYLLIEDYIILNYFMDIPAIKKRYFFSEFNLNFLNEILINLLFFEKFIKEKYKLNFINHYYLKNLEKNSKIKNLILINSLVNVN